MLRKLLIAILLVAPLGLFPVLRHLPKTGEDRYVMPLPDPLTRDQRLVLACLSISPGQTFPASLPWEPLRDIGQEQSRALEELARTKPVEFLQKCLDRYDRDVRSYRLLFVKHERVAGKVQKPEKIVIHFKEEPFSVHFDWKEGAGQALRTLYVKGENAEKLVVRVNAFGFQGPVMKFPVDGPQAKATSRFPITQFGLRHGASATINSMLAARERNALHLKYEGIKFLEAVGRRCYVLVRDPYDPPEDDGIAKITIYIDTETLFQVGSELRDSKGEMIADYYFRDIELNPTFSEKQFTSKGL